MSTALAAAKAKLPLLAGQRLTFTAGRVEITVECLRVNEVYTLVTYQGAYRVEDQCGSYPSEDTARAIARGYAHLALQEAGR